MYWLCAHSTPQCLPSRDWIIVLSDVQLLLTLGMVVRLICSQGILIWTCPRRKWKFIVGIWGSPWNPAKKAQHSQAWKWEVGLHPRQLWRGLLSQTHAVSLPVTMHSICNLLVTDNPAHGVSLPKPSVWQRSWLVVQALNANSRGAIWLALLIFQRHHRPLVLWSVLPSSHCLVQRRWDHVAS